MPQATIRYVEHPESLRTRDACQHGLTAKQLRNRNWQSPAHGLRAQASVSDLHARCRSIQRILPVSGYFSHLTAAALHGFWMPGGLPATWRLPKPASLIATSATMEPSSDVHHDRRGVFVRRCNVPAEHRQLMGDVRIVTPVWTLVELAEHLSLIDLVVAMDGALHNGACSRAELESAAVTRRRGIRTYRRAVALADSRSESPWETVLRLVHVLSGITNVEPQHELRSENGELLARGDLWLRGTRRWAEYDGAVHRDREVHQRDLRREKWLARSGWERYGYTATEIRKEPRTVVRDAEAALGLEHDPTRVHPWVAQYHLSSLSSPGAHALAGRLRTMERLLARRRRHGPSEKAH